MLRIIVFISCLFCFNCCLANYKHTIQRGIQRIITHTKGFNLKQTNIGVVVQSLKTGQILFSRHPNYLFTPASVQKLFTAIAALTYLKPGFRFKTELITSGKIAHGVLNGNLYFKFSGDPLLKLKDLRYLIDRLQFLGIRRIHGRVYIDDTEFNRVPYPPGWIWDDLSYDYAAPLNAIIINHNKFLIQLTPNAKLNHPPLIKTNLPNGVIQMTNYMLTTKHYSKDCPITIYSDVKNHYRFGGCLPLNSGKQRRTLAIRNLIPYVKIELVHLLKESNISYQKSIIRHQAPKKAKVLAVHFSKTLKKITHEMLKKSDNLTTNAVFKKLGQKYFPTQGTWQNSLKALKKILAPLTGINFKHNLLADGAGLSRYNLIQPIQLIKLLRFAYHKKHIYRPLLNALPIAGRDGTLRYRMLKEGRSQCVRAKTGSMTGVSSLAGYIFTKHHGPFAFAIMINGFTKPRKPYLRVENKICEFLARQ